MGIEVNQKAVSCECRCGSDNQQSYRSTYLAAVRKRDAASREQGEEGEQNCAYRKLLVLFYVIKMQLQGDPTEAE
jgi:hypothetical protein